LAGYRAYSPPQQGRHLYDIELLHPALVTGEGDSAARGQVTKFS
jgi:hypothetical protein